MKILYFLGFSFVTVSALFVTLSNYFGMGGI